MTIAPDKVDTVTLTIDGLSVTVPKGTLIIRAAEQLGIQIPRFCDHPLLDPVGACRQCIVEVEGQRKPVASCTAAVTPDMVVKTQLTSPVAEKAQRGTLELLLINHPLDCPVCDKGGECPLQNQAMSNGAAESRFRDVKRTYPKPLAISSQVLLDRERCVLCARCTRFSKQVAGDPFIELLERSALEQVGIASDEPFQSYFSGNTVQICPVGALTGAAYRFRARPFDLVSTPSVCEHCASGCALRTDWRRGKVLRRLAGEDPAVNEEWNCDKGRWAFTYATGKARLAQPLVRNAAGELEPTSWSEAFTVAARGLSAAREAGGVGVLPGGRLTYEDAYAYAKFARVALGTNDVDFRARPHSDEEALFLGAHVAGKPLEVTYADLENAPAVLLVAFEPEEESPIVFLRMRKGWRKHGTKVWSVAPLATRGLDKLGGTLIQATPGAEPKVLDALRAGELPDLTSLSDALRTPGAVILVGERAAGIRGAYSAASLLALNTGATLGWVPRRAGERGAVEAGALPTLLPGGRQVTSQVARSAVESAWGVSVPETPGRSTGEILAAAASGELGGLIVGGVDPDDLPDPAVARAALDAAPFVVSLEVRRSAVADYADVVFPVAPVTEKGGSFINWEGRVRPFGLTLEGTGAMSDARVLDALADELGAYLGASSAEAVLADATALGVAGPDADPPPSPMEPAAPRVSPGDGEAVLATWHHLLDVGTLQEGEEHLAGTAKPAFAHLSPGTAAELGVRAGAHILVSTDRGAIQLPVAITEMPDRVVWVPTNSVDSRVRPTLGVGAGDLVRVTAGSPTGAGPGPDGGLGDVEARATSDGGDPADGGRPAVDSDEGES
ncbi:NADH-quinone oxidoreductase subunit G [Cryptosporangium aurantiacum]|uniref:NADH-quinone oxidoreductase n=1 Tax=Cryptosporangium aurantiacum TaxID=134849 RepID=A0A1M7RH11_9ACTN|nr:NADH-quinone oxidoreductase subunit G [Cryptosporangium aurantiacum]SHN45537.1 NADH dehydrogenase subunit G [Cryptosporangium aurantiacum]